MAQLNIPRGVDKSTRIALQKFAKKFRGDSTPTFGTVQLTNLTGSRLVASNSTDELVSVTNLTSWVAGTANRITVADDSDGTITLSGPQDIHTGASPTFAGLTLSGITNTYFVYSNLGVLTGYSTLKVADSGNIRVAGSAGIYFGDDNNTAVWNTGTSLKLIDDTKILLDAPTIDLDDNNLTTTGGITAGASTFGDGGTTNYSQFEADGTLEFNGDATVWKDINVAGAILPAIPAKAPGKDEFVDNLGADTGIETYAVNVGEEVHGSFEIQHDYKEGSDFQFHVHWQGIAAPTGTDKVKWQLTYAVARNDATLSPVTTITVETDFDTQYEFVRSNFAAITGTNYLIGDQFLFALERIAASADEYAGDALLATVGVHYELARVGSRTSESA